MLPPNPLKTSIDLAFLPEDLRDYPWLKRTTRCYYIGDLIAEGAFGTAYHAYPCDEQGTRLSDIELVVKVPKIQREGRTDEEIEDRLKYIRRKSRQDFFHIRKRLLGCIHANPVIDLAECSNGSFDLPVTIQPFLKDAVDLDEWLFQMKLRQNRASNDERMKHPNWYGVAERLRWVNLVLQIGRAIEDVHRRRVTHADIHPGNVFIRTSEPHTVVFIDFGEAFVATPSKNSRVRNANPYLAPERLGPRFMLNEQVDIYSFGILMLYLATGFEKQIPPDRPPGGHRAIVYDEIRKKNPALIADEPRILDIIGRSISRDPADRPRMVDICGDLESIASSLKGIQVDTQPIHDEILALITRQFAEASQHHSPVLTRLLQRELRELAYTMSGLQTEMVELSGTRDQLIRAMVSLLDSLQSGDSWTTVTTLGLWQRSALGLDGSYASANIRAIKRDVAVRRTFVISVEEIGRDFAENIRAILSNSTDERLLRLAMLFREAIREHDQLIDYPNYVAPAPEVVAWHRTRLLYLIDFLHKFVVEWELSTFIEREAPVRVVKSAGSYLGICPVSTLEKVGEIREDNPASLMHTANEPDEERKWLLVMTMVRGRKESKELIEKPHLLGIRVFKSVQGVPYDRIEFAERLMNKRAVNIGLITAQLHKIVYAADRADKNHVKLPVRDSTDEDGSDI